MLTLDSDRWDGLDQAYGRAGDVPRVLTALESLDDPGQRKALWFALWRMLCQQGNVFTASYAAVPHLLRIGSAFPFSERIGAIHLVCRVELLRRTPAAPPVPDDLVASYADAIDGLPTIVSGCTNEFWEIDVAQILAAALVIGKRQGALGALILELGNDEQHQEAELPS